jgi:hypothetical protein
METCGDFNRHVVVRSLLRESFRPWTHGKLLLNFQPYMPFVPPKGTRVLALVLRRT